MSTKLAITLKKLRESRNISIMALSEKCGIGNGTIGNIERGTSYGRISTLEKISKALNLNKQEREELFNCVVPEDIKLTKDKLSVVELGCKIPVYSKVFAGENGVLEFGELIEYIKQCLSDSLIIHHIVLIRIHYHVALSLVLLFMTSKAFSNPTLKSRSAIHIYGKNSPPVCPYTG